MVIEAAFYDGELIGEPDGKGGVIPETCPDWLPAVVPVTHPSTKWCREGEVFFSGDELRIGTLEGPLTVSPGDYIIRGVKGEIYPCKPDIFAATYEEVEPTA